MKKTKNCMVGLLFFLCSLRILTPGVFVSASSDSFAAQEASSEIPKKQWIRKGADYYYADAKGKCVRGKLYNIQGKMYYFNKSGKRYSGWKTISGKGRYYFGKKGVMARNKWIKIKGAYYYLKSNGKMAIRQWIHIGKKHYYCDAKGRRVTGIVQLKKKVYTFDKKGICQEKKTLDLTKKMIAITYDDGPGPYTSRLLDYLEKNNGLATFFVVGSSIPSNTSVVKRAWKMGCEIGNHTYNHLQLSSLPVLGIQSQISKTNGLIRGITGQNPSLMRPPYGDYNATVASAVGMSLILWDIDTRDWATRNAQATIKCVQGNVRDGSIILMHDIHSATVDASGILIPWLKKQGYQLVTVSQLAKYKGVKLRSGQVYRGF